MKTNVIVHPLTDFEINRRSIILTIIDIFSLMEMGGPVDDDQVPNHTQLSLASLTSPSVRPSVRPYVGKKIPELLMAIGLDAMTL